MKKYLSLSLIIVLSCVSGALFIFQLNSQSTILELRKNEAIRTDIGTRKRLIIVENIDLSKGQIGARVQDEPLHDQMRIVFRVDEHTKLQKQVPLVENGVVVGFEELELLPLSALKPGDQLFGRFQIDRAGIPYASIMILGSPFVLP